jgi:hypothetical protein
LFLYSQEYIYDAIEEGYRTEQNILAIEAQLAGADLRVADLRGAGLMRARLEAADLTGAKLAGADFSEAQLPAAVFGDADTTLANLRQPYLWRATVDRCAEAQILAPSFTPAPTDRIEKFIARTVEGLPGQTGGKLQNTLRERLVTKPVDDQAIRRNWHECEAKAVAQEEWDRRYITFFTDLACREDEDARYVATAAAMRSGFYVLAPSARERAIIHVLLGTDCPAAARLDDDTRSHLRKRMRNDAL